MKNIGKIFLVLFFCLAAVVTVSAAGETEDSSSTTGVTTLRFSW